PPSKMLSSILGKSNLQFAGMSISLTISTASLNLRTPDSKQWLIVLENLVVHSVAGVMRSGVVCGIAS
ncbi:SHC-transforming protein 3, partial [Saguinus oedipus]